MSSTFIFFDFYTALILCFGQYISAFSFLYCPSPLFRAVHFSVFISILPFFSVSGSTFLLFHFYTALFLCFGQYISLFWLLYCPKQVTKAYHQVLDFLRKNKNLYFLQNINCVGAGAEQVGALADGQLILYERFKLRFTKRIDFTPHMICWAVWRYDLYAMQPCIFI